MATESTAETNWQPIVTSGPLADTVRDALADLARELQPEALLASDWKPYPGISSGCAGLALFYGYLARAYSDSALSEVCDQWIDHTIVGLAGTDLAPALHGGFTGVGWAIEHCTELFSGADDEDGDGEDDEDFDANEDIESAILRLVSLTPWHDTYDLISGLAGFGVFCLERPQMPRSREILHQIVERLAERATFQADEVTWHTPPEELIGWQRELEPEGYYNVGVAHGIPALIGILAGCIRLNVNRGKAETLLDGVENWFWKQALPTSAKSFFPSWISPLKEATSSRLAWCYGDAGIAATLLAATQLLGRDDDRVLDLARRAARRTLEESGVEDCGLCHGGAGLTQIFNRLYQSTREDLFRDAALRWLEATLEMRDPEMGLGGFWSQETRGAGQEKERVAIPGFLTGAAGVGLVLLAATTPLEPGWDRVLMMSLMERPAA